MCLVARSLPGDRLRMHRDAVWIFEPRKTLVAGDPQYMTMFAPLPLRQCSHVEINEFPSSCQYYVPGVAGILDLLVARGPIEDLSGLPGMQTSSGTCIF